MLRAGVLALAALDAGRGRGPAVAPAVIMLRHAEVAVGSVPVHDREDLRDVDARRAAGIWKRDRCNHASPNSAQTESVMAGALSVQLAGPAWYFGEYYEKPTIGDALRRVEPEDILRANRMLYVGSFLGLLLMSALRIGVLLLV